MENFECNRNVAQLKDEEFLPTFVGWNKFQIFCVYTLICVKYFHICAVHFCLLQRVYPYSTLLMEAVR